MKDLIIKHSEALFLHFGFSKVTTNDIAERAGISKKTLYNHFTNKEEILDEVIHYIFEDLRQQLDQVMDKDLVFGIKMKKVIDLVSMTLAKLNTHFLEDIQRKLPKTWYLLVHQKDELVKKYFVRLLDEGIASGDVNRNINKDIAVLMLIISIEHLFDPNFLRNLPRDIFPNVPKTTGEIFDKILYILYHGILTDPDKNQL